MSQREQVELELLRRSIAAGGDGEFTLADEAKLDGIETGATGDQSDSEIETAYNNQVAVVSTVEAEAGTLADVRRWTPERVGEAIAALSGTPASGVVTIDDTDSPYTVLSTTSAVLVDATAGAVTVVLPAVSAERVINVKRVDASAEVVTVDGDGAETIDGETSIELTVQYESVTLVADATEWWIL